jgi:DNA-binding NarL/FixJ family response regulator
MNAAAAGATALPTTVALVAPSTARLRRLLGAEGFEVVAGVRTAAGLTVTVVSGVDVFVLQVHGASTHPGSEIRAVQELAPDAGIVLVSPPLNLRELRVLLAEGVDSFVLQDQAERSLGPAVRGAAAGLLTFPGSVRATMVKPALSSREKQVLGLVVLGLTNSEIARKLHLTESTVKSHLSSSFTKLGARSRSEATALILDPTTGLGTGILTIAGDA